MNARERLEVDLAEIDALLKPQRRHRLALWLGALATALFGLTARAFARHHGGV
jgi:hypothetical protein